MPFKAFPIRRRSLAAVAVLLFTLLTLAAALPHEHGGAAASPHAASGLSAAAAPFDAPARCPVCDWLVCPRLSAPSPGLVLLTAALLPLLFPPLVSALLSSPFPRPRSRGPPLRTS